ncbi:olfactory receptor 2L8-like [Gracilinanus agilis]|uniref:olfactory receptor 2L8-like n=1 Tax=Gracilinanus agilis TaxID=191870 RepID=UPI001CFCE3C1|nr:olfactory receptor 2L8-like [Gracilinanus agilis]
MERGNTTSTTDFILLGLFPGMKHIDFIISIIFLIYIFAITGNVILIFLIWADSRLHTPMYILLSQLSVIDVAFISSVVPKMVIDFFSGKKDISHLGCGSQMFFSLMLGGAECILITLMAYDRYVAVCNPLRYVVIMNHNICVQMVVGSWIGGALNSLVQTIYTMHFQFCNSREINYFFCEVMAVLKLSCEDTSTYEMGILMAGIVFVLIPLGLILTSYILIFLSVLHMNSPEGRNKALATCSSHLTVVSLYFGPGIFIYMMPRSSQILKLNQILSILCTILTPMLNPLIYSLRNKDMVGALRKVLERFLCSK